MTTVLMPGQSFLFVLIARKGRLLAYAIGAKGHVASNVYDDIILMDEILRGEEESCNQTLNRICGMCEHAAGVYVWEGAANVYVEGVVVGGAGYKPSENDELTFTEGNMRKATVKDLADYGLPIA